MTTDSFQYFAQKTFNQRTKATFNFLFLGFLRWKFHIKQHVIKMADGIFFLWWLEFILLYLLYMEYLLFRPDVLALCNFILYIGLKALPDRENFEGRMPPCFHYDSIKVNSLHILYHIQCRKFLVCHYRAHHFRTKHHEHF